MSSEKKRSRNNGDENEARLAKKAKVNTAEAKEVAVDDTTEKKKKKKDKKDKKNKEKKEKKKSDEVTEEVTEQEDVAMAEVAPETSTEPSAEASAEPESEKKSKKEKKEKKDKKDKKSKKSSKSDESTPLENGDKANGSTNGVTNGASNGKYSYKQTAALDAVPETEIKAFLEKHEISITDPSNLNLRPVTDFSQLPSSTLMSKKPFGTFTAPTPIQAASWPFALSGRDVVGIAETGSGKTYAFSLPCIEALLSTPKPKDFNRSRYATHVRAVIVSPTRELAMQTHESISKLASLVGLSAVCIYGGSDKNEQRTRLQKNFGADIIVATPGRLKDFLSEGTISLADASFAVLDEADRMLDKGFEEDIKLILGSCLPREKRQTLMFTATWPTEVRGLAEGFMVNPVKVMIGNRSRGGENGEGKGAHELQANIRIEQKVEVMDDRGKEHRLVEVIRDATKGSAKNDRILVFCLYKKEADRVSQSLERRGIKVASIHGDLRQEQRTRSLDAFKTGKTTVLVATDVAARGLDIPEVKLVINCTFPLTIEDYVHRIGRTGRAGKTGKAITFFTEKDKALSGALINILRAANQPVPEDLLKFGGTVKKKTHEAYGNFAKDVDMSVKGKKITFD
ncbi:ATP-dependent RNA helicase [Rhypophila decipiens]